MRDRTEGGRRDACDAKTRPKSREQATHEEIPLDIQHGLLEDRIIKHDPEDCSFVSDDEQLAFAVDAKRSGFFRAVADLSDLDELAVGLGERPNSFRFEITEDVGTDVRGTAPTAIDIAAGDRNTVFAAKGSRTAHLSIRALLT